MWRGCSAGFKTFGRTAGSTIAFHVLKERSHSNGSSEALAMAPSKGVGDCVGLRPDAAAAPPISAALEDTAVALLAGSTLAISETSNPRRHPLNGARETSVAKHRFPLGAEIRDADEGKHWCFQMLFCLLVKQCLVSLLYTNTTSRPAPNDANINIHYYSA